MVVKKISIPLFVWSCRWTCFLWRFEFFLYQLPTNIIKVFWTIWINLS